VKILKRVLPIAIILAVLVTSLMPAQVVFASSKFEYYDTGGNVPVSIRGVNWKAQTFTPSEAHTITSVRLLIYRMGSPGTLTVSIQGTSEGHTGGNQETSDNSGGNWTTFANNDFMFEEWGTSAAVPTVVTLDPTNITDLTATFNGNLTDLGEGAANADVWFEWSYIVENFENSTTPENKTSTGTFSKDVNLPVGGREFKYWAVAENDLGQTGYGDTKTFWTTPFPVTIAEDNYVDFQGVITHVFQRKAWYAAGRHWIIYLKKSAASPDGGFYWRSSTDGMSWSAASLFWEIGEETPPGCEVISECDELNVYFDGTYLHAVFVFARNSDNSEDVYNNIWYRRGIPNSDGTITWSFDWAVALARDTTTVKGYASIVCDTNGYPWIDYWQSEGLDPQKYTPTGDWDRNVIKSSTKDGTFTIADGYPYALKENCGFRGTGSLIQLLGGKLYWVGCGEGIRYVVGRLYNGTSWEGEVAIANDAFGWYRFSAVAREGIVYVVYTKYASKPTDINFTMLLESGWTTPTTIVTGLGPSSTRIPSATMTIDSATGNLYVFWPDYNTDHIKYRKYSSSSQTWGSVEDIIDESQHHLVDGHLSTCIGSCYEVYGNYVGVMQTSAVLNGFLISDGGETCSVRFQWGTDTTYGTDTTWQGGKTSSTSFGQDITGLTSNTTYHFRAQAKWADETTSSGIDQTFVTTATGVPTITTSSAAGITTTSATLQGILSSLGDYSSVYVSFEYGLTPAYGTTTADQTKTAVGGFNTNISGLTPNQTYHFRARVRYDSSYAYGSDVSFVTTALGAPSITTITAAEVIGSSAKLQGTLDSLGNYSPVYVYFEYGQTVSYGVITAEQTKTSAGGFYQTVSGLSPGTTYHYRAVGRYDSNYVYGSDGSFVTPMAGEPGIDPPDILRIDDIKVFTNYLETNDQLYVISYRIIYESGTPILDVSDYFDFQLLDGTTLKAQIPVRSWDYKPGSIYLGVDSALTWGGNYTIKIIGNPNKWETPPECYRNITSGDWQGSDLTQLDTWVISLAQSLQTYYNSEIIIYTTGGQAVLSSQGGVIFNMGIPGLSSVRPHLFSAMTEFPQPGWEEHEREYEGTLVPSEKLGPYLTGMLEDGAGFFGIEMETFGGMLFGITYLALAVLIGMFTRPLVGLGLASPVIILGAWFGLIPLSFIMILAGVIALYVVFLVWVRGV